MILPELSLILECCKGRASVDDAIYMKKTEISDSLYNPEYNIIFDFETFIDSTINASTIDFYDFLKSLGIKSKIAIMTAAPHQVVISMILKELSANMGTAKIEVFSTSQAAIKFLGLPEESFGMINNKIIELNNSTL